MKFFMIRIIFDIHRENRLVQLIFGSDEHREISRWLFYMALKENREQFISSVEKVKYHNFKDFH